MIPSLDHVPGGLRAAKRDKALVAELLGTVARFGHHEQERLNTQPPWGSFLVRKKPSTGQDQMFARLVGLSTGSHHQLRHQICNARDTCISEKEELSALAVNYNRSVNGHKHYASDNNDEKEAKQGCAPNFCRAHTSYRRWCGGDEDRGLVP